jgi:uncharacterized protein involved in outer membrane biogenesis
MIMSDSKQSVSETPKRRRGRWWLLAAVVVVVLLLVIVPRLIDVETYRGQIEAALQSATGWEAELGEIDLSLLPSTSLTVSPVRLQATGNSSSIDIERLEVRAALFGLFKGTLDIHSIIAVEPDIKLVRPAAAEEWIMPFTTSADAESTTRPPAAEGAPGSGASDATSESSMRVAIGEIQIKRGRLLLEDQSTTPPLTVDLQNVSMAYYPESLKMSGTGNFGETGGSFEWQGSLGGLITIDLSALPTESLDPWLGADLIHRGGLLSGQLQLHGLSRIEGQFNGERVTLLSGEQPFSTASVAFEITSNGPDWTLERMDLKAGDVSITGAGSLLPELALEMDLGATPLEAVIAASASVLPLPLDLSPPGELTAQLSVNQPQGGELTYEARGTASASALSLGEPLPDVQNLGADFNLSRNGVLELQIHEGTVAGGPLRGTGRLDSIDPPGEFVFKGQIENAALGGLLDGFVEQASERVSGPTGIDAQVSIDLSQSELDTRAIGGVVKLASREVAMPEWDLDAALREGIAGNLGQKTKPQETQETGDAAAIKELLETLQFDIDFDSWPWKLDNLSLKAQDIELKGVGTFDPVAGNVALELSSVLGVERTRELIEEHSELKLLVDRQGILSLPLSLKGPMLSPSFHIELDDLLSRALKDRKDDAVEDLVKGLLDRL